MNNAILQLVPLAIVIGVFYFLVILPSRKQQEEHKKMISSLRPGDKVVTIGGIRGMVASVKDDVITLRVGGDTKIDVEKSAIARKI